MNDSLRQLDAPVRDWRVPCCDGSGQAKVCVIDTDHGAVRVGFPDEQEQFCELRAEQVTTFQAGLGALLATLGMVSADETAQTVRWEGYCYNKWDELTRCQIESTEHDAVRISCVLPGEQNCFFELRGDQIGVFRAALAQAIDVFHADVAIHGHYWANQETDEIDAPQPSSLEKSVFTQEINKMVAEDAPEMLAVVGEVGDRVDAVILGYCLKFLNHAEVISAGSGYVRGIFRSVESAHKLLSAGDESKLWMVSVTEAQKQTNAT